MLPYQLIIRCPDLSLVQPLFAFLQSEGVVWGGYEKSFVRCRDRLPILRKSKTGYRVFLFGV